MTRSEGEKGEVTFSLRPVSYTHLTLGEAAFLLQLGLQIIAVSYTHLVLEVW